MLSMGAGPSWKERTAKIPQQANELAKIGSTELETPRTGETHKTSAASVVLFGKDGKALWTAP